MVKENTITQPKKNESNLSKFNLGFEYDRTWREVKRDIRVRTQK